MTSAGAPMTVLVVDDDDDIREALGLVLSDLGCPVIAARNGREGLELARAAKGGVHFVLLDLMMPVMSGWQFLEERRRDPALQALPVWVMTAARDATVEDASVRGVLRKPIAYEELERVLAAVGKRPERVGEPA